ncbi:hypothetical protein ACJROX_24285 [Pseudalkalibacillus sp. A8]|uniref:hypothetical protein n=1 Tax=Pseudalkalibacillus sp. A8 TaxID=3382641 RepID=UPI0038B5EA8F
MKKFSFLLFVVSVIFLLAACADSTSTTSENKEKKPEAEQRHNTAEKSKDYDKKDTEPVKPYEALKPSDDAKHLKENLSEEELEKMPAAEAYGDERRTRSVPVGQTLVNGTKDESNGPLKNNRIVTFYGHPNSTNMGILGELEPDVLMKKLKEQTKSYSHADPSKPAIPAIELITTVAQRNPGPEGKYYRMTPEDDIEEYAKLAKENNALLLLDVQLGKDSVMNQVQLIEKWLNRPYVHLAIDTEFHVGEGELLGWTLAK